MVKCEYCGEELNGRKGQKYCSRPKNCSGKHRYILNKEHIRQQVREWQAKNPEKVKEMNKRNFDKWRKKNPERFKELMKKQYEKHKEKWNTRGFSHNHRKEILDKFNEKCNDCGSKSNLEIHHIDYSLDIINHNVVKLDKRGENLKINIDKVEVLCHKCHIKRHRNQKL